MSANEPKTVRIGPLELRFLVDERHGPEMVMFEFTVPPGARVPVPHYHRDVDEAAYGLEGVMTVQIDGRTTELRPGEVVFVPRGAVHHHANLHETTARVLCVLTPGSIGRRYFEEMAAALAAPGGPDPAAMKEIMLRHGLVPA